MIFSKLLGYMLFLLDPAGVPSVGSFVQVINNPTHTPPTGIITSPASDVVIQAGQSVNFTGTATDPDGTVTNLWWFFPGATPNASTSPNTGPIVFPNQGVYVVSLTAVDNWGTNGPVHQRESLCGTCTVVFAFLSIP
jgi:hypothetical protein